MIDKYASYMGLKSFGMSKLALEKNACPNRDAIVFFSKFQHYELVIAYVI